MLRVDVFGERLSRDDAARVVHEIREQPILVAGECDDCATHGDASPAGIEGHVAAPEFGLRVTVRSTNQRPHARQHLFDAVRLGQIVVGAAVDAEDAFAPAAAGGEHEDGHGESCLAPAPQEREPVDAGQSEIQQHRVVGLGPRQEVRGRTIGGTVDRVAGGSQRHSKLLGQGRLVLRYQHPHSSVIARSFLNGA